VIKSNAKLVLLTLTELGQHETIKIIGMPKTITRKQQRLFFSRNSPLSMLERDKLAREIRAGDVRIKGKK